MFGLLAIIKGLETKVLVGLAAVGFLAAFVAGFGLRDTMCDAASAKQQLAIQKIEVEKLTRELSGYKTGAEQAQMAVATLTDLKEKQDAAIAQLRVELGRAPASCRATVDTVRRLLRIP
jgi:hypothetical protein